MKKLIIKLFVGDPIKTARFMIPIGIIWGILSVYSEGWNWFDTVLLSLVLLIAFLSFGYLNWFPLKEHEK